MSKTTICVKLLFFRGITWLYLLLVYNFGNSQLGGNLGFLGILTLICIIRLSNKPDICIKTLYMCEITFHQRYNMTIFIACVQFQLFSIRQPFWIFSDFNVNVYPKLSNKPDICIKTLYVWNYLSLEVLHDYIYCLCTFSAILISPQGGHFEFSGILTLICPPNYQINHICVYKHYMCVMTFL